MLSIPPPILQEAGTQKSIRAYLFVAAYLMSAAALTFYANILPRTADFHNTVGLMGALLPVYTAWLAAWLPQPMSLFVPSRLFSKYLSLCVLLVFSVAASFVFPAVLTFFGELSFAHIMGAYLGLVLLGVAYLSLGLCLRLMISSAPALGVVSFVVSACLYVTIFEPRFQSFVKGLPSLGGAVFFVSFTVFFVAVTALCMSSLRRSAVMQRAILTGLCLALLNVYAVRRQVYADLTSGRIFSLSQATLSVLDSLEDPIEILANFPPASGDPYFDISREILLAYGRHPNVRVSFSPPRRLAGEFGGLAPGSVVAVGGGINHGHGSVKVIPPEKLFITNFDEDELNIYISGINIEAELTNAILYCTTCENPVLAQVSGNSEQPVPQGFVNALISANYGIAQICLAEEDIPPEVSVLLITTPADDWSEREIARLERHFEGGGGAVFALDARSRNPQRLAAMLDGFGIELGDRIVAETQNYLHMDSNVVAATQPFGAGGRARRVLIPNARAVYLSGNPSRNLDVQGVITTSPFAFERPHPWETGAAEQLGTFALAARIEAVRANPATTRLVVLGSSNIFDETANELSGGENYRFLIDAINWTQGIEQSLDIPPVAVNTPRLAMDAFQSVIIATLLGVFWPGLIVSAGLLISR